MRPQQVLLLGLILLVPVLAFLFLKSFGTNRYALPTYLPERVDSTLVAGSWQRDTVYHQIGKFRLRAQSGRQVTGAELRNQGLYVLSTFATNCPTDCGRQNAQLVRVQEKFRQEPRVRLASISVNSVQDSAAALARYAESYGAIAGKWFFLAGDKMPVERLLTQEFGLPQAQSEAGPDHPHTVLLIDRDGHVRGRYDGTSERDMNRLITEIDVLLYTYEHP